MSSKWNRYILGDIVDIKHGFAFKGEFFSDTPTDDILLTPGNFRIGGGFKNDKFKYYNGKYPSEYILKEGDVIVTMTDLSKEGDTLGYSAIIPKSESKRLLHNQRLGLLQFKRNDFDKRFIYWLLRTKQYQTFIVNSATGSTVKHTSPSRIREYQFEAPDLLSQHRIADILSALDEKIEINRQTSATLKGIEQAVFKEWFVNFNFPNTTGEMIESELGMIPKGWKVTVFEDELEAERGLSYKGAGLESGNAMPMHNLNSVFEGGGYKFEGIKYYSGEHKEKHIVQPGDLIVANTEQGHKYLLIGYPAIVPSTFGDTGIYSHHIYRVRPKSNSHLTADFVYQLLLQLAIREQVIGFANGTTVNMLKIEGLRKPKFVLPPKELVVQFSELAMNIRLRHEENINQSATLAAVRDLLLPKLMSGEIDLTNH